jgi:hypothetical protein
MVSLDNYLAERAIRGPVVTRKNARGSFTQSPINEKMSARTG